MNGIFSVATVIAMAGMSGPGALPAVTASFSRQSGQLTVVGNTFANNIVISRTAAGDILVNNGEVAIAGGTPTTRNTRIIDVRDFADGGPGRDVAYGCERVIHVP